MAEVIGVSSGSSRPNPIMAQRPDDGIVPAEIQGLLARNHMLGKRKAPIMHLAHVSFTVRRFGCP